MADPVSILMAVNASLGIARSLVHTIKELYELAEQYETAALAIRTLATQCNTFRVAIQRISKWLATQDETSRQNLDEDFWQALMENLNTGALVISDIEKRIKGLKKDSAKFWIRTKYLWNSVVIGELQTQMQGLMSAVSILVQVIEMPTVGGKRSQSLAQRSRLNNITKSVRQTVDQRRQRIQNSQEQSLLDEVDSEPLPATLQEPLPTSMTEQRMTSQNPAPPQTNSANVEIEQWGQVSNMTSAPPAYDYYGSDFHDARKGSTTSPGDTKKPLEGPLATSESSFKVLDRSDVPDENTKRSKWMMGFKKRSSTPKVEQVARTSSGPTNNLSSTEPAAASNVLNPFDDNNSQMHQTPAPMDGSKQTDEYFGLQMAMAGMSMPEEAKSSSVSGSDSANISSVVTPPVEAEDVRLSSLPMRPNAADRSQSSGYGGLSARSDLSGTPLGSNYPESANTQSYYPPPLEPTKASPRSPPVSYASSNPQPTAFERIRPSQRVKESRDRSHSREPSRQTTTSSDSTSGLSLSRTTTESGPTAQTWRTNSTNPITALRTSSHIRVKVTYDPSLYTSRISAPAAQALHLLEHALTNTIDNVPIATLTLLYTVSDGESQSVMGDEVELEVMHEQESRGLEIVFGAGQIHVGGIMEGSEGGVIWWSERGVPKGLRTVEGLRLFKRFELSRW